MPSLFYVNDCVVVDIDEYRSASVSDVLPALARLHGLRTVRPGHPWPVVRERSRRLDGVR
jgi:hypothetical protein